MCLGPMLGANAALSWLDLTNTRMGAEACLMLAEGIKHNTTLEVRGGVGVGCRAGLGRAAGRERQQGWEGRAGGTAMRAVLSPSTV